MEKSGTPIFSSFSFSSPSGSEILELMGDSGGGAGALSATDFVSALVATLSRLSFSLNFLLLLPLLTGGAERRSR